MRFYQYIKHCEYRYCGKVILPGKHGTRKYCSDAHRQAENKIKNAELTEFIKKQEKEDAVEWAEYMKKWNAENPEPIEENQETDEEILRQFNIDVTPNNKYCEISGFD